MEAGSIFFLQKNFRSAADGIQDRSLISVKAYADLTPGLYVSGFVQQSHFYGRAADVQSKNLHI